MRDTIGLKLGCAGTLPDIPASVVKLGGAGQVLQLAMFGIEGHLTNDKLRK